MDQQTLFETPIETLSPTPQGVRANVNGSASGNDWHRVCETRLVGYGFELLERRSRIGGDFEYDGWFRNPVGLHVRAEYKERIYQGTFMQLLGQAYLAHAHERSKRMVVIVLAGHLDPNLTEKAGMINAASDLIYYVGNPQNPDAEKFLRLLSRTKPEETQGVVHQDLTDRIRKLGGFPGLYPPKWMH